MTDILKKVRPIRKDWMLTLGAFLVVQLLFIVLDNSSWSPFKEFSEGGLFDRLSDMKFFTEWFTPYKTKEFNLFTVLFAIIFLPAAIMSAIKDFFSRK
ncbi:hypothetical protein BVG16_27990 [Paenibacillus selenitireducens]|uniref:YfzA-like protein n=1 Tax=Paenibacillus selenitireducens TaxID=1324314 RepID=A0A1T2X1P5_9BACL|nr:YfzA family protein [Paenibacillus selenitireducens]OPA73646.1 hypothetical protein BVG16_27990 [Paenibacillus selenitireducens]